MHHTNAHKRYHISGEKKQQQQQNFTLERLSKFARVR